MSETLLGSDNPLWYIDDNNDSIVNVFCIFEKEFSNLQPGQGVMDVFSDFVESRKLSTLFSLIAYAVEKKMV